MVHIDIDDKRIMEFVHRFGAGPGGGPFSWRRGGGGPFRFGRLFRDGDLRLVTLALLEESPRHGYDIIKALEERSGGVYSPSPGVVYPTLTFLEEAGYATAAADGNKKVYSITDAGRAHLNEHRKEVETILEDMAAFGSKVSRARQWFEWTEGEGGDQPGREEAGTTSGLNRARRRLRALIMAADEGTEADQKRVADILNRASDEILGQGKR